jgi:hypothetical protein
MSQPPSTLLQEPALLRFLAFTAFAGCAALALGTLIAPFFVPGYDRVADTISDLAAGEAEIFMALAFYGFAAGLMATALAAAHAHVDGRRWSVATVMLAVLAALVVIIGARNEYGDSDSDGVVIHIYLVYLLAVLVALVPLLMARGVAWGMPRSGRALVGLAILWIIAAPVFFFLHTGYDGLYEKLLGIVAAAIIVVLNLFFFHRARL